MKKNIIFDLGGVVVDIDLEAFYTAFKSLGYESAEDFFNMENQSKLCHLFETGKLTADVFLKEFSKLIKNAYNTDMLKNTWNAMIKGITHETIECLKILKSKVKIYALSNTNVLHYQFINNHLISNHNIETLHDLFDDIYMSYEGGFRKPDEQCFIQALKKFDISPSSSLFIDDLKTNLDAAEKLGIKTLLKSRNETLKIFLNKHHLL